MSTLSCFSGTILLLVAVSAYCQDLRVRQSVTVDGSPVSVAETSIHGSRERIETFSPTGSTIVIKQCDLKRSVTLDDESQTFTPSTDPKENSSASAATPSIIQTITVTDTGQKRPLFDLPARRLQISVTVDSSKGACTEISQKYEVDGWFVDLPQPQAACGPFLPQVKLGPGCNDVIVRHWNGNAKLAFPIKEWLTIHGGDDTTTSIVVKTINLHHEELDPALFEIPPAYQQAK